MSKEKDLVIYQTKSGSLELKEDFSNQTIWATQKQIADIFGVNVRTVNDHILNIFKSGELNKKSVIRNIRITASDGKSYNTNHYNLDLIISVGYRVNSKTATQFRIWATKTLKDHITKGFTINKKRIKENQETFLKTVEDIKYLIEDNNKLKGADVLNLIKSFSDTWFSLQDYDKQSFPKKGTKRSVKITSSDLEDNLNFLKKDLIKRKEAGDLFAQEKIAGNLSGIIGNIFQSAFGNDLYPSLEEKAAHLLYFIIKNHPFNDGNKRSAAFSFIWFLNKSKVKGVSKITPETLTALTILIAESDPKDKDRMIGVVLLLLNFKRKNV